MKFLRLKKYSKIITQPLTVFLLLAHLAKSSLQVKHCSVYSTSAPEKVTGKKEFFFFFFLQMVLVYYLYFLYVLLISIHTVIKVLEFRGEPVL